MKKVLSEKSSWQRNETCVWKRILQNCELNVRCKARAALRYLRSTWGAIAKHIPPFCAQPR